MSNKKLGVLGGMGPMATSMFFERIIEKTKATCDQEHLDMVIFNHASMPDRTSAILSGEYDPFLSNVKKDLMALESLGVENIAIPCNTSHFFMPQMLEMTKIPIINMVEETASEIKKRYGTGTRVAILATNGTIETGTYEKACIANALEFVKPNVELQKVVMKTIYDIKSDVPIDKAELEGIIKHMRDVEKCKCIILACTELSLIKLEPEIAESCIDAMDVLVEKSILYSGGTFKG